MNKAQDERDVEADETIGVITALHFFTGATHCLGCYLE